MFPNADHEDLIDFVSADTLGLLFGKGMACRGVKRDGQGVRGAGVGGSGGGGISLREDGR